MYEVLRGPLPPPTYWALHGRGRTRNGAWTRTRPVRTTVCSAKVYIAATHLEGMDRVESLLKGLGEGVQDVVALHTMTIIEEAVEGDNSLKVCDGPSAGCWCFEL